MEFKPHPYQTRAVDFTLSTPRCALWLGMGLGKTSIVLTAITELFDACEVNRVLVLAPKRVAVSTWPREIRKWSHTDWIPHAVLSGTPTARAAALARESLVDIVNYEQIAWLDEHFNGVWPYDMIVADEFTRLKSHQAKRWKVLRKRVFKKCTRFVGLTGTPAPNGLIDLWAPTYLLDRGVRLGTAVTRFRKQYFTSDYMGFSWEPKPGTTERLPQLVEDITLSLKAEDYLTLPPVVSNIVPVELTPALREMYAELEKDMYLKLEQGEVQASNAAVLVSKTSQFANGALYDDNRDWHEVHKLKLEALDDVIEEANGEPVLVAYQFKSDLARVLSRYKSAQALGDDPEQIESWNRGEIPILCAHPASAGHGLNLQYGGRILVWFGMTWNLEHYMQMLERIGPTRQAQSGLNRTVFNHHIVVRGTTDETMLEAVVSKRSVQDVLIANVELAGG